MPDMRGFSPRVNIGASALYGRLRHLGSHERPEISSILDNMDLDLEDYFSEIATLKARLAFLEAQSDRLQNHRAALRSLLSPIHRLPNELLTPILVYACRTNSINGAPRDALTVAAICHRWRTLAISSAEIWSNILIILSDVHENSSSLLDLFLSRSRQHPLRLQIVSAGMVWDEIRVNPLFQRLVDSSPRWQHLSLFALELGADDIPSLGDIVLPSLETMDLALYARNVALTLHSLWITPKLRKIDSSWLLVFPAESVPDRITSLGFTPSSVSNDLVVPGPLDSFPNIQHLRLRDTNSGARGFPRFNCSPRSINLTSLELTLRSLVTGPDRIDLLEFSMDSLTVPTLSTFIIRSQTIVADTSLKHSFPRICTFLGRSGCALTVLELKGLVIADHYVVDLFWHLHSLTHLTINDPVSDSEIPSFPVTKELIESLHTHRPSSLHPSLDPLLPKLYSVVLSVRSKGFHHPSFISTIISRWIPDQAYAAQIGVSCLRSVELHLVEPVDQDDYLPLTHLERAGMRFVVKCNPPKLPRN